MRMSAIVHEPQYPLPPAEHTSSAVMVEVIAGIAIWRPKSEVRKKNRNCMFCKETVMVGIGPPGRPAYPSAVCVYVITTLAGVIDGKMSHIPLL